MIACGLALNVAVFTLFNHYVLRPLPVRAPSSLYEFSWVDRNGSPQGFAWSDYSRLETEREVFSDVAAFRTVFARVNGRALQGALVTGNYFTMLGVGAALGRTLGTADAMAPGQGAVIVLSHSTWQSRFGGASDIVGRHIALRGVQFEVVGVAARGFNGLSETPLDFWVPVTMANQLEAGRDLFGPEQPRGLRILGRLQPHLSTAQAEARLGTWIDHLTAQRPEANRAVRATLQSRATAVPLTPQVMVAFSPVAIVFGLVLGLACANVANMMLARGLGRQRELGIRVALGATPARLIRQLLTESSLVAFAAGCLAVPISQIIIKGSVNVMLATLPAGMEDLVQQVPLETDTRVLIFTMIAALLATIVFGLVPAVQTTRTDAILATRGEFSNDWRPARLRNALVVAQVAICVLLLISSGVLIRGAKAIGGFDVGYATDGVIVVRVEDTQKTRVLEVLSSEPEVQQIAAASSTPMNGLLPSLVLTNKAGGTESRVWYNEVSPEYFSSLGIPIVQGREFRPEEGTPHAPVVIVSNAMVQRVWPNQNAVGQTVYIQRRLRNRGSEESIQGQLVTVIGVARDIVSCCIAYGRDPALIYLPTTVSAAESSLIVRVRGDTGAVRRALDAKLEAIAPGAVQEIRPLMEFHASGIYPFRAASWIGSALGGVAWVLALSGMYGVLSYLVAQRTREIGIRMALGATSVAIIRLILNQTIGVATAGMIVGTALALAVSRVLSSKLLFINPHDSLAYAGALILVTLAAIGAALLPARRSARIDPTTALRFD
jgi:predicted permease